MGGNGRHSAQTLGWPRSTPPALALSLAVLPSCGKSGARDTQDRAPTGPSEHGRSQPPAAPRVDVSALGRCPVLQPAEEADQATWGPPWKSTPTSGRLPTSPPLRRMSRGGLMAEKVNVGTPRGEQFDFMGQGRGNSEFGPHSQQAAWLRRRMCDSLPPRPPFCRGWMMLGACGGPEAAG